MLEPYDHHHRHPPQLLRSLIPPPRLRLSGAPMDAGCGAVSRFCVSFTMCTGGLPVSAFLAIWHFKCGSSLPRIARQFSLFRWFSMVLQASSASAKVLKGEPMILIAPRLW